MEKEKILANREHLNLVVPENDGKEICVAGFVKTIRDVSKNLKFVILEDISGEAQLTFLEKNLGEEKLKEVSELTPQSVICAKGKVKKSELCKRGVELIVSEFYLLSKSDAPLPIDITGEAHTSLDKRLDWRVIDLRDRKRRIIFQMLSDFEKFSREYFYEEGLTEIHTPKLMGAASESGAEVFEVKYFDKKAYLAQSPQFYKQMVLCGGFEKVFEIAPTFRAEPSYTTRHLTEFISLDVEIAYISSFEDLMKFEEKFLVYVLSKLKKKWGEIAKEEFGAEIDVPKIPFPKIKWRKVIEILKERGLDIKEGEDFGTPGEKMLGEYVKEELKHDFVFITEFPWNLRPFYHMRKDKDTTLSFDLLYKGVEITTGAQREHRYDVLVSQAKEKGLDIKNLGFYLNFFRYGAPPHGGFGLGPSRVLMQLLNLQNIRETTLLPRDPKRLLP